jgi:hypothetical protein
LSLIGGRRSTAKALVTVRYARRSSTVDHHAATHPAPRAGEPRRDRCRSPPNRCISFDQHG